MELQFDIWWRAWINGRERIMDALSSGIIGGSGIGG